MPDPISAHIQSIRQRLIHHTDGSFFVRGIHLVLRLWTTCGIEPMEVGRIQGLQGLQSSSQARVRYVRGDRVFEQSATKCALLVAAKYLDQTQPAIEGTSHESNVASVEGRISFCSCRSREFRRVGGSGFASTSLVKTDSCSTPEYRSFDFSYCGALQSSKAGCEMEKSFKRRRSHSGRKRKKHQRHLETGNGRSSRDRGKVESMAERLGTRRLISCPPLSQIRNRGGRAPRCQENNRTPRYPVSVGRQE